MENNITNIKPGDILKYKKSGREVKVIEVFTNSAILQYEGASPSIYTLKEIEDLFDIPKEKWVPTLGSSYYFIDTIGEVFKTQNEISSDSQRIVFNNYFKTEAEAESARDKVKELLLTLKK